MWEFFIFFYGATDRTLVRKRERIRDEDEIWTMWFEPQMTDLQRPFQVLDSFQYTGGNGGRRDPSDVSFHVRVSQYVLLRWLLSHLSPGGTKVTADKSPLAQHQLSRVPIEVRRKQQLSDMNVK